MPSGKPTLRDVAKAAGFSPMTASNALHGKPGVKDSTRAKVLAVAEKLDYRINLTASMLKSGRSNIIHIIVNEFDSPFYSKLVESLVTETTARGLTPFVEQTRYSPDAAKHALANNPFSGQLFDGEIIHASGLNAGVPLSAINHGRPLVLIDACEETPTFDTVNFPNEDGARAAVQHLIECGCHRIAIVGDGYSPRTELAHVEVPAVCVYAGPAAHCLTPGCRMTNRRTSLVTVATAASKPVMPSPRRCSRLVRNRLMTLLSPVPRTPRKQREAPRPSMASSALTTMPHSE